MRKLSLLQLVGLSVVLAVGGGWLYVQLRAWLGDDQPSLFYLAAIGIGTTVGLVADHRRHPAAVALIAALCAIGACLVGNFRVATLERRAIEREFDIHAVETDEFYIALEAYTSKYPQSAVAPPFTYVAKQAYYSADEWGEAEKKWRDKSQNERDALRIKWRSDFAELHRIADERLANVFHASWDWSTYLVSAVIATAIVIFFQLDARRDARR